MEAVLGFRFSGVSAGIKKKQGALDLALLVADRPVPTAALFTRNLVRASPVHLSERRILASGMSQACLVNSGCANACTGEAGDRAALETTAAVAAALNIDAEYVLPASTGVIGQVLDTKKVAAALPALIAGLSPDAHTNFAEAILTTDQWTKLAEAAIEGETTEGAEATARLFAIGKGAGMFHPDLGVAGELPQADGSGWGDELAGLHATMLVFIVTDAVCDKSDLARALELAADRTLNAASVDGDTSTNDSVYLMASGASGVQVTSDALTEALTEALGKLARSMVRDGEGAEHVVEIVVAGLGSDAEAREVARSIATSPLVKTAIAGKDVNWGRILAAAGRAGVSFDPRVASLEVDGVAVVRDGVATSNEADLQASERMRQESYAMELTLGSGPGRFSYLTSDLGHAYIDVNASYRS